MREPLVPPIGSAPGILHSLESVWVLTVTTSGF